VVSHIDNYKEATEEQKIELIQTMGSIQHIQEICEDAYQNKGSALWKEVQFLLMHMNTKLMDQGYALGSSRAQLAWDLRGVIERTEQKYLVNPYSIPEGMTDPDEFLAWLKHDVIEPHGVNHHALFDLFDSDDLSDEDVRYFLSNYRVNMKRFHLHVAAYSLIVPFEMREELYENLHDEFGEGNFDEAHPNLFEPMMDHFGGARDEDCTAETACLLNTKVNLCWFGDGLHYGMGGMGALELSIPFQQKRILAHLRRRGLSEELLKFFVVHCELDTDHGDGWFEAGKPYMNEVEEFQKVLDSAVRMLDAREGVYQGILEGILARRA
jgi:pyrroloquinoline quinone (PQQ) biosynthesis protein C